LSYQQLTCFDKAKEAKKIGGSIFLSLKITIPGTPGIAATASKMILVSKVIKKLLKNYHLASIIKPVTHTVCSFNKRSK
jgi:hypothetical protein